MSAADRLAQIRARADAATPGPWDAVTSETRGQIGYPIKNAAGTVILFSGFGPRGGPQELDAVLAAHARTDVPALLAAVESVLGLHQPIEVSRGVFAAFGVICTECHGSYPCPTLLAITEALT